jgi:hypothetical protein
MRLNKYLVEEEITFDGRQLRPGWAVKRCGLGGEIITAFLGPFRPSGDEIAGLGDSAHFLDRPLLHFIVEHQHQNPEVLRLQQQLLLNVLKDKLNHRLKGDVVQRWSQDLCRDSAHITISALRVHPSCAMIYVGVNLGGEGNAGETWGLQDGGIDPRELAQAVMDQYIFEIESSRRPLD